MRSPTQVDPLAAGSSGKSSRKSKKKKPAKRGHRKHKDSDASSDSDDEPVAPKAAPPPAAKDASRPANDGKKAKGPPKPYVSAPKLPAGQCCALLQHNGIDSSVGANLTPSPLPPPPPHCPRLLSHPASIFPPRIAASMRLRTRCASAPSRASRTPPGASRGAAAEVPSPSPARTK